MTLQKILRSISMLVFAIIIGSAPAIAQAANTGTTEAGKTSGQTSSKGKTEKKYSNYMELAEAKKLCENRMKLNQKLLLELRVAITNFGTDANKKTLTDLKENFVEGNKQYYKKFYLEGAETLEKNFKDIRNLYDEVNTNYQQRASDMLSRSADGIVELDLGIDNSTGANPTEVMATANKVQGNRYRLAIGYDHYNNGEYALREGNPTNALIHYRQAKNQAVRILIDLATTEDERKKVSDEYRKDIDDADNKITK